MLISERDTAWLACDALDYVAVFTTAGEGLMPEWIGKPDYEAAEAISELSVVGEAILSVPLPKPTWYESIASCGIYAYDWYIDEYRLLATPTKAIKVSELPAAFASAARHTRLPTVEFGLATAFDAMRLVGSAVELEKGKKS